jgi:hypothetical protein
MMYAFPKWGGDSINLSTRRSGMEDADIEQRFHLMQKEIEATVSLMTESKLDLMTAIDSLRIELEVLKSYMERYHPGFADSYPKFKEEAIRRSILNGSARNRQKSLKAADPARHYEEDIHHGDAEYAE